MDANGKVGRRPNVLGVHSIDHFALEVPDLEEARRFYALFGLDVRDKDGTIELYSKDNPHRWAILSQGDGPKRLRYLSFGVFDDEMEAFRTHLDGQRVRYIDAPAGAESNGLWFESFDGLPVNVRVADKSTPDEKSRFSFTSAVPGTSGAIPNSKAPKVYPRRLSHFALFASDVPAAIDYYEKTLGLRLSDKSGPAVAFLHGAHGSDHHLLALVMSDRRGMHHNSWDVGSVAEVGLGGATMERAGYGPGWGLGQHVLGANYFYYVRDPWGSYSEYSADMDFIPHDVDWPAGDHPPEDSMFLWGPNPQPEFIQNFEPAPGTETAI
jgi:catechol 2,3-dioxygenase-like lactoylglutathione lyase family enzyme